MPTFGSLFAGIGGIDLGLERAGWECRFQVEWDAYCQAVLAKHWPDVPRYGDITTVDWSGVERVDLLAGGFPCQPFSVAGRRKGTADDRWLWPEFARAVGALRPSLVLVENVPGLLAGGGMGAVLGGLAELGYDAQWDSIPAAAVGAPHLRYRVWIVAHRAELAGTLADADIWRPFHEVRAGWDAARNGGADVPDASGDQYEGGASANGGPATPDVLPDANGKRREVLWRDGLLVTEPPLRHDIDRRRSPVADTSSIGRQSWREGDASEGTERGQSDRGGIRQPLADPDGEGSQGRSVHPERADQRLAGTGSVAHTASVGGGAFGADLDGSPGPDGAIRGGGQWLTEPDVGRVAHGVPARVDRLRALGNAVVPQVVEVIGRQLLASMTPELANR